MDGWSKGHMVKIVYPHVCVCLCQCAATGELMMSLFWYYRPEHTQGGRDPSAHCEVRLEWAAAKMTFSPVVQANSSFQHGEQLFARDK